jgi:hypothetical protein
MLLRNALGLSLLLLSSCGGAGGAAVQPKDFTGAKALGTAPQKCAGTPKLARPIVVDLDPDARVDLEAAMKKGLVVVSYDCASLRVLSACRAKEGSYEFAGVSRKEQVVQMKSQDELSVNLPLSAGKLGGEVQSGRSIDLALVLIGRSTTTVDVLNKAALAGNCEGATHYLQNASLGAFSMATGSAGKISAVSELFGVGASGKSEASRSAQTSDGSLDACRKSDPDAPAPPTECRSPLRVELQPLSESAPVVASAAKPEEQPEVSACPAGYSFAGGICTRTPATAHLCDPKNTEECRAECDKGSLESCYNFGIYQSPATASPYLKKACDGGHGNSCGALAIYILTLRKGDAARAEAIGQATRGCELGGSESCSALGVALSQDHKDDAGAVKAYRRSCAFGDDEGCRKLGDFYLFGWGVKIDVARANALYVRACEGSDALACFALAEAFASGKNAPKDPAKAADYKHKACVRGFKEACK